MTALLIATSVPLLTMSAYNTSALWAEWVGSVAAVASVAVAIVFGYLTLANTRRSKDAQERAAVAAVTTRPEAVGGGAPGAAGGAAAERADAGPAGSTGPAGSADAGSVRFAVRPGGGERWELVNEGPDTAYGVRIEGLTDLDRRRLTYVGDEPDALEPGAVRQFVLVSRLALSGPANVVVRYRVQADGAVVQQVLLVSAP